MRFQLRETVDDVDARFLEAVRPVDVAPFVEPRLELHQHGHLFPGARGLDQPLDER